MISSMPNTIITRAKIVNAIGLHRQLAKS